MTNTENIIFRVTEQDSQTIERSYDVEASSPEEAQEIFESLDSGEKLVYFIHEETVSSNCEVTAVEPVDS